MTETNEFSPVQVQVLALLSEGHSTAAAIQTAGVHRNTIGNWRRASADFRAAWERALSEQTVSIRDHIVSLVPTAIEALKNLLVNPQTPPGVRLRAALAVLQQAATPPPPDPRTIAQSEETTHRELIGTMQTLITHLDQKAVNDSAVHNPAQPPADSPAPTQRKSIGEMLNAITGTPTRPPF